MIDQADTAAPKKPKRHLLKWLFLTMIGLLLALVIAIFAFAQSDRGTRWLLDFVLDRQQMISYQYASGNLVQGVVLKNIGVKVKDVEVKVDYADVHLGWRAVVNREIHLMNAKVGTVLVINNAPSEDKEFEFSELKLPFVLRLDHATLKKLSLQTTTSTINFYDIELNEAIWSGAKIQLVNSSIAMDFLNAKKITGDIQLDQKYPLQLTGEITIPALESLNLHKISLDARGDIDTLRAAVASATPDIISGYVILHPVRKDVPMTGKIKWSNFNWPILPEQKLYSEAGQVEISGDLKQLNFLVDSDLKGDAVPRGAYRASLNTDLSALNIEDFNGRVIGGDINLAGKLGWTDGVTWDIKGDLIGLDPKSKDIPEIAQQFLPPNLNAQLSSVGKLDEQMEMKAVVDFERYEEWQVSLFQASQKKSPQPLEVNVVWKDINRQLPYIGWLQSQNGDVDLILKEKGQDIVLATDIAAHKQSVLPAGKYSATLNFADQILNLKKFALIQGKSSLEGQALVHLPTEKSELKWQAQLNAKDFNPQAVSASIPINQIDGQITANGYSQRNKQIINLNKVNLTAQVQQQAATQQVRLTGQSTAALIMHETANQSGLKGFAVSYKGDLAAKGYTEGPLDIDVSGTPTFIKIAKLYHKGAAGQIDAKGQVNLAQGLSWDIDAAVQDFKYLLSPDLGELNGRVNTSGHWSDQKKYISIKDLDLRGHYKKKPILGKGNLAASFSESDGFVPKQFEANNLVLSYANNIVQATGNAQRLQLNINAPNLQNVYEGLRGTVKGYLSLQTQPQFSVSSNLIANKLAYRNVVQLERLSLIGTLPTGKTPTKLTFLVEELKSGERKINHLDLSLLGTLHAHKLSLEAKNNDSFFATQLVGGFNENNDWLGQFREGKFDSKRIKLMQDKPASLIYRNINQQVMLTGHCWKSQGRQESQICLEQPAAVVSKAKGSVALNLKNLELGDFQAFMPAGLHLEGRLNGHTHLAWIEGQPMKLDALLITKEGKVGLESDDPDIAPTSLGYNQVKLTAKTLAEGLSIRLSADTPLLGTGYVDALVGMSGEDKAVSGSLALTNVKLDLIKPFISDLRTLEGRLFAAGKLSGTLKKPLFNGEVRLRDGALAMMSVPLSLQNIQLSSTIKGTKMNILGGFNAGRGAAKLEGLVDWSNSMLIDLSLKGTDLLVAQPPMIEAAVSPDLHVTIRPTQQQLTVAGKINVPYAVISMPESSPNVIGVTEDVRIVRTGQDMLATLKSSKPWNIRADIDASLGKNVVFRGFGSEMPLVGGINLSQRGTEIAMRANGAIGVARQVAIEAYGQRLNLNRAIARFGGELANPSLDIDASKSVQSSTVGVRVTGVANRPLINIYNDAGLTEQEALNALITGRISSGSSGLNNTEGFKSDINNTLAAAGLSMGLGGTRAFTNQLGRSFGLNSLALDAQGSGDDTQVSVTGYLTPDLYLRYGVGIFTPVNKLTLRYQMNRRLYLEATSSVERAVDVFYHWRF